jgi:hypothetical protein
MSATTNTGVEQSRVNLAVTLAAEHFSRGLGGGPRISGRSRRTSWNDVEGEWRGNAHSVILAFSLSETLEEIVPSRSVSFVLN